MTGNLSLLLSARIFVSATAAPASVETTYNYNVAYVGLL